MLATATPAGKPTEPASWDWAPQTTPVSFTTGWKLGSHGWAEEGVNWGLVLGLSLGILRRELLRHSVHGLLQCQLTKMDHHLQDSETSKPLHSGCSQSETTFSPSPCPLSARLKLQTAVPSNAHVKVGRGRRSPTHTHTHPRTHPPTHPRTHARTHAHLKTVTMETSCHRPGLQIGTPRSLERSGKGTCNKITSGGPQSLKPPGHTRYNYV